MAWLRCLGASPGTGGSWRGVGKGAAAGAVGDGELGPGAASRKAGHAGPGAWGGGFQGLSRRGAGAWPPPARPSLRRRRRARRRRRERRRAFP